MIDLEQFRKQRERENKLFGYYLIANIAIAVIVGTAFAYVLFHFLRKFW